MTEWERYDVGALVLAQLHLDEAVDLISAYTRGAEHEHQPTLLDSARAAYTRAFLILREAGFINEEST